MTRIDNPYSTISPKTKYQWHCYWVFEDGEFQQEVSEYLINLEGYEDARKNVHGNKKDRLRKEHADFMLNERRNICEKYQISIGDFMLFNTRHDKYPLYKMSGVFSDLIDIKISEIDENIAIRFKPSISKTEYVKAWNEIREFIEFEAERKKLVIKRTKRKEEVDYQLIYAIFKARTNGMSYSKIFKLYGEGKLPNYKGLQNNRFKTYKELNDYYLRNSAPKDPL